MKNVGNQKSSECNNFLGITIAGNSFSTWYKKHELYINAICAMSNY